jgi:prophage antirepressor-like protein
MNEIQIFKNKNLNCELTYISDAEGEPWFRGKDVALTLGYSKTNTVKVINKQVEIEDRVILRDISVASILEATKYDLKSIYVNESGIYSLIMGSKLPAAKDFKRWVTKEVLPSIRKTGRYELLHEPVRNQLTFKIENEFDLHTKIMNFINNQYPDALTVATLGELQDTPKKRINSKRLGYQKGSPDIIINNLHKTYVGLCIELKTPKGNGVISASQEKMLQNYRDNHFKVLTSNSYDECVIELINYFKDVRICCQYCSRRFLNKETLKCHHKGFHKMDN